jgi:hypothetical protein
LNHWLSNRGIPDSREYIQKGLEILRARNTNHLSLSSYGLNLTDHYWICPAEAERDWHEINFFENKFSDYIGDVLFDNIEKYEKDLFSPDGTLNGNLKKRWKIIDNTRYLLKGGSGDIRQEPFNKVIASTIMDKLGVDHVLYTLMLNRGKYYCTCPCMVNADTEYITAHYVYNHFDDNATLNKYERYVNACERMGLADIKTALNHMIAADYIIANTDRHHGNFGIIRDPNTLQWLKPAPIFDSGTSLWTDKMNIAHINAAAKTKSRAFMNYNEEQVSLIENYTWFNKNALRSIKEESREILSKNKDIESERINALCESLQKRVSSFSLMMNKSHKHTSSHDIDYNL